MKEAAMLMLLLLSCYPRPNESIFLQGFRDLYKGPPPTSVPDIVEKSFLQKVMSFQKGSYLYFTSNPVCSWSSFKMMLACAPQYEHVIRTFGVPSFAPNVTPEKQTPEYLATLPHPSAACCHASGVFHSNLCACDVQTIEAFRNLMLFDPEMTVPGSNYLYGELCHAPVVVGDSCPNGNPFDLIRANAG